MADSWTVASDTGDQTGSSVSISAVNTSSDGVTVTGSAGDPATTVNAMIGGGTRNTISASAIGASASLSFNSTSAVDGASTAMIQGGVSVDAQNIDSPISNLGDIQNAEIVDGAFNSISRNAVGASATVSANVVVSGGATRSETYTIAGATSVTASNNSDITLQTDLGTAGDASAGPRILDGNSNSISASAIGASASIALTTIVEDGSADVTFNVGTDPSNPDNAPQDVTVSASNDGNITVGSTADVAESAGIYGAQIAGSGSNNSIAINAVGATATISATTLVKSGTATPLHLGNYSLASTNTGTITNVPALSTGPDDAPQITSTGSNNTVSGSAIGATMSFNVVYRDATDGSIDLGSHDTTIGEIAFVGTNTGAILANGDLLYISLDGIGRSISANAIGVSMSFALGN